MNQKLSDWASVAEILSGVAVVVTLVFLILELRESTSVMRATAFERNIQSFIDSRRMMAQDPDLTRVAIEARSDFLSMSPEDQVRARVWWQSNFLSYEKAYYARAYGLLGEGESQRFTRLACDSLPTFVPELREQILEPLTVEYVDYLRTVPECDGVRSWFEASVSNGN